MANGRTTQTTRGSRARAERHARRLRRAWAVVGTFLLALPLVLVPAVPASAATWSISKEATTQGPYSPGQLVTYEV